MAVSTSFKKMLRERIEAKKQSSSLFLTEDTDLTSGEVKNVLNEVWWPVTEHRVQAYNTLRALKVMAEHNPRITVEVYNEMVMVLNVCLQIINGSLSKVPSGLYAKSKWHGKEAELDRKNERLLSEDPTIKAYSRSEVIEKLEHYFKNIENMKKQIELRSDVVFSLNTTESINTVAEVPGLFNDIKDITVASFGLDSSGTNNMTNTYKRISKYLEIKV